jgi:Ca-activated chloride channel homolog
MPRLQDLRAVARLSQTELATASGVSIETIKKIEAGKVERPHPATLRQLAAVLGQVPAIVHGSRDGHVFDSGMLDNIGNHASPVFEVLPDSERKVPAGFVPLRRTTLTGTIDGPLAALTLTQVFGDRRADCDLVLEALYRFPLPGDAAVTGLVVRFGDVVVETDLMPRADAEAQYRTARQQGRRVALSARASTDVFTLRLTGLQPDQDVIVETTFLQVATPDGPGWELRLPLTIGPRYSRPDEAGTPGASGQPLGVWRDPGHRFDLDLVVRTDGIVASPSHSLEVRAD